MKIFILNKWRKLYQFSNLLEFYRYLQNILMEYKLYINRSFNLHKQNKDIWIKGTNS
jgi:hypothetical protein